MDWAALSIRWKPLLIILLILLQLWEVDLHTVLEVDLWLRCLSNFYVLRLFHYLFQCLDNSCFARIWTVQIFCGIERLLRCFTIPNIVSIIFEHSQIDVGPDEIIDYFVFKRIGLRCGKLSLGPKLLLRDKRFEDVLFCILCLQICYFFMRLIRPKHRSSHSINDYFIN